MRTLSASELLDAWERGVAQHPLERALTLLAAARPEMTPEALAALSVGCRDADLFSLRELTFGPHLVSVTDCPQCAERLELELDVSELRAPAAPEPPRT